MKTLCSNILPRIPEINIYKLLVYLRNWNVKVKKNMVTILKKLPVLHILC